MLEKEEMHKNTFKPLCMLAAITLAFGISTSSAHAAEQRKSTIVCSQRDPASWKAMILNDEVSANSIMKRVTKHYTIKINTR